MKKYGVGIIGCGAIFSMHAYPLYKQHNAEIKAVCDIRKERAEAASKLFECDSYGDYRELLARDDIDVVHILTPHYLHAPMTQAASEAGKHVLSEKPMSISMKEAEAIVNAGTKNGTTIGIISQNRYNAASQAIKRALSEDLGKIVGQRVILAWSKPAEYYKRSDWHGTWDKEGGSLMIDQAIHVMDLARWFIDEPIDRVQASFCNRNHPEIETEDTAEGLITYRSGIQSVFFATNNFSYNAPVVIETQCENGTAVVEFDKAVITYLNGREVTVVNNPHEHFDEEDYSSFFNEKSSETAMRTLDEWGVEIFPVTWKTPRAYWGKSHHKQIENFYASLAAGKKPDVTAEEALKTQEMIMSIYQSGREGKEISLLSR